MKFIVIFLPDILSDTLLKLKMHRVVPKTLAGLYKPSVHNFKYLYSVCQCHSSSVVPDSTDSNLRLTHRENQTIQNLASVGFSQRKSLAMLSEHPQLVSCSLKTIEYTFQVLQSFGFKTEEIKSVLAAEPRIIGLNPKKLKNTFMHLLKELGKHNGQVAARTTPSVLMENVISMSEKIEYCVTEMRLPKPTIAKSQILKFDLDFIQTRHGFAYRSGYYKKIDSKNHEGTTQNPSVSDLLFSTDKNFVSQFKGLSLEEYLVFEDMISAEKRQEDLSEEDDEDEYSSDEDDDQPTNSYLNKHNHGKWCFLFYLVSAIKQWTDFNSLLF